MRPAVVILFWTLALVGAGCEDKKASTGYDSVAFSKSVVGEHRARRFTDSWLEKAKTEGGKEIKAVRSWKVLKIEEGTFVYADGKREGKFQGFSVGVIVDHSNDSGMQVSNEFVFYYEITNQLSHFNKNEPVYAKLVGEDVVQIIKR